MRPKNLVFEGGGVKIIAYYGALKVLNDNDYLQGIQKYLGSSGGAIVATLLAVGYTVPELEHLITQRIPLAETNRCCNGLKSIYGIICRYGMHPTNKFEDWLGKLIEKKLGSPDITFEELYYKTGKTLVITGSCLNQSRLHFYHYIKSI